MTNFVNPIKNKILRFWVLCFVLIFGNVALLTNSFIESLKSPRLSTVEVTQNMDHIVSRTTLLIEEEFMALVIQEP